MKLVAMHGAIAATEVVFINFLALSPRATGGRFGSAPHAPLPLPSVLSAPPRTHDTPFPYAWPHKPRPPPAVASPHVRCALRPFLVFLFRVPTFF